MYLLAESANSVLDATPAPVKWLGSTAAAIVSLGVIWKFVRHLAHALTLLQSIAKELTPNGGGSVKDKVNAAAADSRAALDLARAQDVKIDEQGRKIDKASRLHRVQRKRLQAVEAKVDGVCDEQRDTVRNIARLILHEGRGDLGSSRLYAEMEKLLSKEEMAAFNAETERLRGQQKMPPAAHP